MFQDEARFGRVSLPKKSWSKKPNSPICSSQIIREYIYAYSAISPSDGKIDSLIAPRADMSIMAIFLKQVSDRFPDDNIIMIMDKAAWHTTKKLQIPDNIELAFLPPYSPQLNPVEYLWKEIKGKYFSNRVFKNIDGVEEQLMTALTYVNQNENYVKSFFCYQWIADSLLSF